MPIYLQHHFLAYATLNPFYFEFHIFNILQNFLLNAAKFQFKYKWNKCF